jgi:hypothetical protein
MPITLYLILGSLIAGFGSGFYFEHLRWEAQMKDIVEANYQGVRTKDRVKEKIVKVFVERVVEVEKVTQENVNDAKNIPAGSCPSEPIGFIELHNAAAVGHKANSSIVADGSPSGVDPAAAATVIAKNYGTYLKLAEQVRGLQQYINEVCQ